MGFGFYIDDHCEANIPSSEWRRFKGDNGYTRKSGLRKITDLPRPCMHPEHNPPSHMYYPPGVYEYTCPGCGHTVQFVVGCIY